MKITALLAENKPILSFEVFPPKTESGFDSVRTATEEIAALHPAAQLRTTSAISAAVAYCDDEPFAVVMPIKAEPETVRAVRAFFTEAAEDNAKTGEADKLRAELADTMAMCGAHSLAEITPDMVRLPK